MNEVPRCQHVKVNGTQCGSPALRRKRFCYFHDNYRQTQARLMEQQSKISMGNFPLLEDANSVQVAVMHVIHMLGSAKIDTKVAGLMLYALQTASSNMKRVSFEAEKVTDVVIDQDTLDRTCINGPQWFDRDFEETAPEENVTEEAEVAAAAKREEPRSREAAKPRKKPDPLRNSPDMDSSLAGLLLKRLGIVGNGEHPGNGEADVPNDGDRMSQN
jgi:hypothetical protein